MFYPVFFKVNIFSTSGDFNIPTIFVPSFTNLLKTFYNFYSLSKVGFGILHILLCKEHTFLISDLPARFEGSLSELFEQRHQLQCGFTSPPSGCLVAFESLKICILLKSCDAIVDLFE